MLLKGRI